MKRGAIIAGLLCLALFAVTVYSFAGRGMFGDSDDFRPAADLFYPTTEDIDLSGRDVLQFKWEQKDIIQTDHYEFKLYKGYNMSDSTLVLKQNVSRGQYPFELPAENFEINQVYTWSLKQVYLSGTKSDKAFSSFKIIKK